MFLRLLAMALLCLTLTGCAQKPPQTAALPNRLTPTKETENDMLRCYPLDNAECRFFALGDDLFAVQPREGGAVLIRYSGKILVQTAAIELPGFHCTIAPFSNGFSCYDPIGKQMTLLNPDLEEERRIQLPKDTREAPVLDSTGTRMYYLTGSGLMEADLFSGIHRLIREMPTGKIGISALIERGSAILCSDQAGRNHCYSTENGAGIGYAPGVIESETISIRDCLALRCGYNDCLYLETSMLPLVPGMHFLSFLPTLHSVLVYESGEELRFSIYDLSTGNLAAKLTKKADGIPIQAAASGDGRVFFVLREPDGRETLYQWMASINPKQDFTVRLSPLYTADHPNQKGLEQCRQRAAFIEEKYGIRILFHEAATQKAPAAYELEPEHITAFLMNALDQVERALLRLPTEFIHETVQQNTTLCLVRSICSKGEEFPYLQAWQGTDSYLYITASEHAEEALLRALSPMIDSRILLHSDAYDNWDSMNPSGFIYGQSDAANLFAFADQVAADCPAEDRASLLLAAIAEGNRDLFCSAVLQNKLRRMCVGIRTAYALEQWKNPLPWEQYLWEPV